MIEMVSIHSDILEEKSTPAIKKNKYNLWLPWEVGRGGKDKLGDWN